MAQVTAARSRSLSLVAALDRRHAIGRGGQLPWRLADDLKRFKVLTLGKPILMGSRTATALGRALPGRQNLVLTRRGVVPFDGMHAVSSLEEAMQRADGDEVMVIGGGEIYALALPVADRLYLTHVDTEVSGADAFFPSFDQSHWLAVHLQAHAADARNEYAYEDVDYRRRP